MPLPTVFGPVITPNAVERAVIATIKTWFDTYLRELERVEGYKVKSLPSIRSFRAADTMEQRFPEQQIPACQVQLTGENKIIVGGPDGHAVYGGTVDILVQSTEPEPTRRLASGYAWMMGLMLEQKSGLDGSLPIEGFGWDQHSVPALGKPGQRWLGLGSVEVAFALQKAFDPLAGPEEPGVEPPNWPVAETARLILDPEA